jgi:hypothetical protein
MLLITDLTTPKPFYILNFFVAFSTNFFLIVVSEIFTQLFNVYAPKYENAEIF